MIYSLRFARKV